MLNFDNQIKKICTKATQQLNVLHRLSKFLSEDTILLIFKSFTQLNFNYCPLIRHFCSKPNAEKLEKLQYRALRIGFNDNTSSYENLLNRVKLPTLHINRLRCIATETYKCTNNLSPEYLRDLVEIKQSNYSFRWTQSRYLQSELSHMGRDPLSPSLPVCGTAYPIKWEQQQASQSSRVWYPFGWAQSVTAPCVAVEKVRSVSCVSVLFFFLCP